MRIALVLLLGAGCGEGGKDSATSGTDTATTTTPPPDAIAVAYAGCTETLAVDAGDGVVTDEVVTTFDAHGNRVHLAWNDLVNPDTSWVGDTTFGAAHQASEGTYKVVDTGKEFEHDTWTWEGGDPTLHEVDFSPGKADDTIDTHTFEEHREVAWSWDYGADGLVDDTATFAWTAVADGWDVVGTGMDPNGPYQIEQQVDSALRWVTSSYSDSTGLALTATDGTFTVEGEAAEYHSQWYQDDVLFYGEDQTGSVDALGRMTERTSVASEYDATGAVTGTETKHWVITYDCPGGARSGWQRLDPNVPARVARPVRPRAARPAG